MGTAPGPVDPIARLAAEIREGSFELALEVVEEGLRDDTVPSLDRVGRLGQLGDVPIFIGELALQLGDPQPGRLRQGAPLAALARDHARNREALGFAPREIVTEFLLLRRVLWRFVARRAPELGADEVLEVERRLDDAIDRLVVECVVAYFDRAMGELALQARQDPLTGLLNHQAFTQALEAEVARAARYHHGLALVSFDVDRFKEVNDTLGHPEGDRVLRVVAKMVDGTLRRNDVAGRMGGDEFSVALVESEADAGGLYLARLHDAIDERIARGELPQGFAVSPGVAHFPTDGVAADALFRAADRRLYDVKRSRAEPAPAPSPDPPAPATPPRPAPE
jgi:diguanylate cyclase (GGDEF)-like protein